MNFNFMKQSLHTELVLNEVINFFESVASSFFKINSFVWILQAIERLIMLNLIGLYYIFKCTLIDLAIIYMLENLIQFLYF